MVYLSTVEEWQKQSSLLLQARPATARITTKYHIPNLDTPRYQRERKRKREGETEQEKEAAAAPRVPKAHLTLKAFDPESGVTLQFKTDKSADVGRIIAGLGRAGRYMAALPEKAEAPEVTMDDAPNGSGSTAVDKNDGVKEAADATSQKPTQPPATGGGGGGKKKKKGKK